MSLKRFVQHPLSPIARRTAVAIFAILVVMTVGTVGIKYLSGWNWLQSFYFMAMLGTAEGPPEVPPNLFSSVFAAVMAFISIGTLITASGIIFGPYLGYLFHKGMRYSQREIEKLEEESKKKQKDQQS
jgi:biotin transporter BioY